MLSQERIELLLSWRRSGFSVHNRVYAHPRDGREFEALVRYMMRSPISLSRLRLAPGAKEVVLAEMRVIGFITEPSLIRRILDHIRKPKRVSRPPPRIGPPLPRQPAASPA